MADPANRDPAEGSRETVNHELARSTKNPEQEAQRPGTPAPGVQGSGSTRPSEPEGQQGSTHHKDL